MKAYYVIQDVIRQGYWSGTYFGGILYAKKWESKIRQTDITTLKTILNKGGGYGTYTIVKIYE